MKRLIIALILCAMPSLAFAADVDFGTKYSATAISIGAKINSTDSVTTIHTLSNNVTATINWDPTAFMCWTKHTSGTKYYGVVTGRTKIYWIEPATFTEPTASTSDTFDTWTSM
jgi:hypothetical protein